jgi:hypothetical protein
MPRDRARALSRRGSRTLTDLANDYALTYAPYIQAAVRDVGHNYRQVAKWLTRERIPAQRDGRWAAQSVKNLVVRYGRLTGTRLLTPYKRFPAPAHRKGGHLLGLAPSAPRLGRCIATVDFGGWGGRLHCREGIDNCILVHRSRWHQPGVSTLKD